MPPPSPLHRSGACTLVAALASVVVALSAAADGEEETCWGGDFSKVLCCGERWGLTGNPICWDAEFTYLRCCGLGAFPRRPEDDAVWDAARESLGEPVRAAEEYDFIVVGAGSAGSVLASRLAAAEGPEGRAWRVLLLEEGPPNRPEAVADPDRPPEDKALWREPLHASWEAGREKRTWGYATGQGLGGTAGVNSMIYMRGSVSEYAAFGWRAEEVLDAFKALEAPMEAPGFVPNPGFHRAAEDISALESEPPGYHLTLVSATPEELPPVFRALITAFEGAGVPFRVDPHGSQTLHGIGGIWRSLGCGHPRCQPTRVPRFRHAKGRPRSSPYTNLVAPMVHSDMHSLDVVTHATVERVVFSSSKQALGVEVSIGSEDRSASNKQKRAYFSAAHEIIVSAGVFNSPKLLTVSGVAEPEELERLGIPLVTSSPEVGRHLHEHVGLSIVVGTSVPCPEGYHETDGGTTHLGNLDEFIAQFYVFLNSTEDTPGAWGPLDAELMVLEGCLEGYLSLTFTVMLLRSNTRGRLVVQSRSPFTSPHLDYKPLSHSTDIDVLANIIRRLYIKVFSAETLQEFDLTVTPAFEIVADIHKLAQWIRSSLYYYSHPGGTCRVSRDGLPGVVDHEFNVLGTRGLRVADASVFPESPTGHTDGPSRLVGELAARFILRDQRGREDRPAVGAKSSIRLHGYAKVDMPLSGFGTNGFEGQRAIDTVSTFLRLGGRLLDTAVLYGNHRAIRAALAASGVPREEVFIIGKIPPGDMGNAEAAASIDRMVEELGTYADLLLIHWPANFDPKAEVPACARAPRGSWRGCRASTWQALEAAQRGGRARAIGVSNFGVRHLTELLQEPSRTLPVAANEVEFHPWWPQPELHRLCAERRVALIAYGSTGGSLTGGAMLRTPAVARVAAEVGRSPTQVLLRWAVQQGVVVIPSSSSEAHVAENLDVTAWKLSSEQMRAVGAVAKRERMRVYLPDPEGAP